MENAKCLVSAGYFLLSKDKVHVTVAGSNVRVELDPEKSG